MTRLLRFVDFNQRYHLPFRSVYRKFIIPPPAFVNSPRKFFPLNKEPAFDIIAPKFFREEIFTDFAHLHVHTEYSLLDGAARIGDLLDAAKNFGMNSLAITDHGTMYGIIDFYKAAQKRGIKPIIGCEVYVAPKSRYLREEIDGVKYFHLVLLAENNDGYKNLLKLASAAALEGFYYRPRVDKELLRKYHGGLIALSACVAGEIPRAILQNNIRRAVELTKEYVDIFGRENFFLELQNHGLDEEIKVRAALKKISAELNIELVATNDSHYVRREDAEFHDLLLCLQTNRTIADKRRMKFSSDDYFLKSAEEMRELFADTPEACDNTLKIAERCNVTIEFGNFQMPEFPLPENYSDAATYLRDLCNEKISARYPTVTEEIRERLNHELEIIHGMGYDGYFLIVYDFINFARRNKIPVGPGRGSAAGSLVAYVLEITELDPLKYNLLFERFLNPERVTLPDIDVDLCYIRRDEVIEYVRSRYGADKVSQIATFGTLAAKAAIRDVVRVLDLNFDIGTKLVKMIPNVLNITLDDAMTKSNALRGEYETNPESKKILDFARKLEGLPRHLSVHAAGVVISQRPLVEVVPLQMSNNVLVTQFDKDKVEELGLLKMDFLGLRTLTIVDNTISNIRKSQGVDVKISEIPLVDELTAKMLSDGKTGAVFQMESAGMTNLVKDLQPASFEDLIPTVALYRPGPLGSGMVEDFIAGRHGRKVTNYLHPKLEPILKETFGVILYQEQVMQIVQTLAGFSLGQADLLRRAMGKKKAEILLAQKENFLQGCAKNGVDKMLAEKIFELLSHFADYGFNKSHSAAYALLAWQTAYLKAHFPAEYMAAIMSAVADADKVAAYVELSRNMGIKVLPPDINSGEVNFSVDNGAIRFGLSAVKTVGESTSESIIAERKRGGKFKSLEDFCARVDLKSCPRRSLEKLIKCGAFDSLDTRRTALLESLDIAIASGAKKQFNRKYGAISLFGDDEIPFKLLNVPERPKKEILAWEKEILCFYVSGHPLDDFRENFSGLTTSAEINDGKFLGKRVKFGGIVTDVRRIMTKRGDPMAFLQLEDFCGKVDVTLFTKVFNDAINLVVPDEIVVVNGKVESKDDSVLILADSVIAAKDYAPDFYLTLPKTLDTPATFDELKKISAANVGDRKIILNRDGCWRRTLLKISDTPEVRAALKNLLGEKNFRAY
ncbi:MAG: DNA polymerase III subunit alpha [Selenomonadaceae bacterium]|nr:DNA polymerase III subunit alpha [Selenomonadaceae bacterium]